ncbi:MULTISPECIES: archaellin/type IV pilin N-terminal domain-containing protein [Salinibaculum]|uniref:archaellin/type IV pilin N-terminal domain-containing protein n=1 Tax=Salinibaculum TaxID=2732368 RepID=UPI0030D0592C
MTPHTRERGQAGIGTLIILIAAMLIAALSVGVMFETTGLLQGKTASASGDVSDQITGQIEIIAVSGQVYDGTTVDVVNVTVKSADGKAVDLRDATIQWVGPSGAATLVWAGANATGPTFGITMVGSAGQRVLADDTDRATLTIDPGDAINATTRIDGQTVDIEETGAGLQPGDRVSVDIVTDSTTTYSLRVPDSLRGNETVGL